jgi:hypothetical protein
MGFKALSVAVFVRWFTLNLQLGCCPLPRASFTIRPSAVLVRAASRLTASDSSST